MPEKPEASPSWPWRYALPGGVLLLVMAIVLRALDPTGTVVEGVRFWFGCLLTGWTWGNGILGILQAALALILPIVFWNRWRAQEKWEERLIKTLVVVFVVLFAFSTFLLAPFTRFRDSETAMRVATNQVHDLTASLSSSIEHERQSEKLVSEYQLENSRLNGRLAQLESQLDPSLEAFKRRTAQLIKELTEFAQRGKSQSSLKEFDVPFAERVKRYSDDSAIWNSEFIVRFSGRLIATMSRFAEFGIVDKEEEQRIANGMRFGTNPLLVEQMAITLSALLEKAK